MNVISRSVRSLLHALSRYKSKSFLAIGTFLVIGLVLVTAGVTFARYSYGDSKASVAKERATTSVHTSTKDSNAAIAAKNSSQTSDNSAANTTLPPYDPRSTSQVLQPTPDKPAVPKTQKPLSISPSSITLHKNVNNAMGVRSGLTSAVITVSSGDGTALYYPSSTGSLLTASTFNTRAAWDMTLYTNYAPLGTTNVAISAIAANGSADYVGTLQITVLPLPTFSVTPTTMTASANGCPSTVTLTNFSGLTYSSGFNASDAPTLTISGNGINISNATYGANSITFTDNCQGYGSYPLTLTFANRYQVLSLPATFTY